MILVFRSRQKCTSWFIMFYYIVVRSGPICVEDSRYLPVFDHRYLRVIDWVLWKHWEGNDGIHYHLLSADICSLTEIIPLHLQFIWRVACGCPIFPFLHMLVRSGRRDATVRLHLLYFTRWVEVKWTNPVIDAVLKLIWSKSCYSKKTHSLNTRVNRQFPRYTVSLNNQAKR